METDVLIIGAGAAGLMAGRELAKAGKKVTILEARDRVGGRIYPLPEEDWGYEAQGGAEFVHGEAPVTRALLKEAGLITDTNVGGEWWNTFEGKPKTQGGAVSYSELLKNKLQELTKDMTVAEFFDTYFLDKKYSALRKRTYRRIEGYFAGDPTRASAFALREEVIDQGGSEGNSNIKEGYGAMLRYLNRECMAYGVEILLRKEVASINWNADKATVIFCVDGSSYTGKKALITVPAPILETLEFKPAVPDKMEAVSKIGFGPAIKILLRFKTRWWSHTRGQNFEKLHFMVSYGGIQAWWTQYPEALFTLTGWVAGPTAQALSEKTDKEILMLALDSLATTFGVPLSDLQNELELSKIVNWPKDSYTRGAYSYSTPESLAARVELNKPVDNKLYFAGEALSQNADSGTVEAALTSGLRVAKQIEML